MNIGTLFNAFDSLRKRDGDLETVIKTVFFYDLMNKYPKKTLREVLSDYKGGSWGNDFFPNCIPAKVLRSPDIRFGFIDFHNAEERYFTENELENYRLKNNDILVIKSNGSLDLVGKSQIFKSNPDNINIVASNFMMVITPNHEVIYPEYLDLFLKSPEALIWRFDTQKTTTGLRNLNTNAFLDIELPVPESIQEQILLFEKFSNCLNGSFIKEDRTIEKFYKIANIKEKISNELTFQLTQLENLNQAILQEAVQGKLVPQDPNDEPASELLKRIKAEKLNSPAFKGRAKELPPIKPEEIPFEIPDSWVWCRLGEIILISSGDGLTSFQMDKIGKIPVYGGNGINGFHSKSNIDSKKIVIGRVGAYCGAVHITENKAWVTDNAFIVSFSESNIDFNWLTYFLRALDLNKMSYKGNQPVISGARVYPLLFPLPPLSEQKRIVAEIEKQFAKTKQLKEHIIANQQATEQLLKALLQKAFEVEEMEDVK